MERTTKRKQMGFKEIHMIKNKKKKIEKYGHDNNSHQNWNLRYGILLVTYIYDHMLSGDWSSIIFKYYIIIC